MSRPGKSGLDYFPVDVNFLGDKKMEGLISRKGPQAALVYLAILCVIYQDSGYYAAWDDDNLLAVSRKSWCTPEYVDDVIEVCLERGLFDTRIYLEHGKLTSAGVQRRYLKAIQERIRKMKRAGLRPNISRQLWLLSERETKELKIEMGIDEGITTAGVSYAHEEAGFFPEKYPKEEKSKVKEDERTQEQTRGRAEDDLPWADVGTFDSEEEPSPAPPMPAAPPTQEMYGFTLSMEDRLALEALYGKEAVEAKMLHLKDWAAERGYHIKRPELKLHAWLAEDARKEYARAAQTSSAPSPGKKTGAHAYAQRVYADDELDALLYTDLDALNA